METASFGDAEFLFGSCPVCKKLVLTYADFVPDNPGNPDDGECELRRCLHCNTIINGGLQAATSAELEANGYRLTEPSPCGAGGGCGAGGCGVPKR